LLVITSEIRQQRDDEEATRCDQRIPARTDAVVSLSA
jgi:hypothetical protein